MISGDSITLFGVVLSTLGGFVDLSVYRFWMIVWFCISRLQGDCGGFLLVVVILFWIWMFRIGLNSYCWYLGFGWLFAGLVGLWCF